MKLAFSTLGCPAWTVEEMARFAAKYEFDAVELRCHADGVHLSPEASRLEAAEVRESFAEEGVRVFALAGYPRFTTADAEERAKAVASAEKLVDLAAELGADFIRLFGGRIAEGMARQDAVKYGAECLRQVAAHAESTKVRIAVETHDDFCAAEELVKMLDAAAHPKICVCWDLHHPLRIAKEPVDRTAKLLKGRVGYCHVKDAFTDRDDHRHIVPVGAGDVPVADMLKLLARDGFDGYLSFEWEKKWHPELAEPEIAFAQYAYKMREIMGRL
jgi:sugar phosphate isomerase/epimerase